MTTPPAACTHCHREPCACVFLLRREDHSQCSYLHVPSIGAHVEWLERRFAQRFGSDVAAHCYASLYGDCRVVRLVPRRATYEQGQADERAAIVADLDRELRIIERQQKQAHGRSKYAHGVAAGFVRGRIAFYMTGLHRAQPSKERR